MELRILDPNMDEYVDVLKVIMLYTDRFSLLPELYEVFGEEHLLRFLDVFAGTIIEVPPPEVLERAVRDVTIYMRMKKSGPVGRGKVISALAEELLISEESVKQTYREVSKIIEQDLGYKILLKQLKNKGACNG